MAKIEIETFYPYPIDIVWQALTEADAVKEWLMDNDFQPIVGHKFRLRAKPQPGWRGYVDCEVLEVARPHRLSYSWQGDEKPNLLVVSWSLESVEGGTKLTLEHTGFKGMGGFILSKFMMGPGWKRMLSRKLPAVMEKIKKGGFR